VGAGTRTIHLPVEENKMTMKYMTLVPAYGRDYKTQAEVKAALDAGKDFQVSNMFDPNDGSYLNSEDMRTMAPIEFHIRYKGLRNICVVRFK
jgi:hypothetical protein